MCCDISFTFDWLIIILYKLYWKFSFKTLIKKNYNLYIFFKIYFQIKIKIINAIIIPNTS